MLATKAQIPDLALEREKKVFLERFNGRYANNELISPTGLRLMISL